jgi:hypothetical protein
VNSRFCLIIGIFLDRYCAAIRNCGKNVQHADGINGIEENLGIILRHSMVAQPSIDNDQVLNFDCEAGTHTRASYPLLVILLPPLHICFCVNLARPHFDRKGRLFGSLDQ